MRYLFLLSSVLLTLSAAAQNVNHWESLVNAGNEWHYFPGVSEPPANWTALTFNDASWQKGPGGIGWGDGDDATVISRVPSVYLRRKFTVSDPEHIVSLIFFIDFDDAFVAYLNGHEIARANIGAPGVKPLFNHYAANCDYEAQLPSGGVPAMFILNSQQKGILNQGENVLAIQVHDCNATSSDLSSTAFLIAGISVPGNFYQAVPGWFTNRLNQTSHLPLIMIDTGGRQIPDEPKINAQMRIIDNGPGNQNSVFDPAREFDGPVGIEVRGQSSQSFPKKSYGFETRTESGGENKVSLLGMPAHDDWVLYAPYSDKSMMRNDLSYYLGRRMGRWQPDAHYVEVYLNGQYIGVYQLIERIKRGNNRVNIAKMESSDVAGDKVTGGYIFKVDKIHDLSSSEYFYANPAYRYKNARNYAYSYYYPKSDAIVWSQRSYLQNFLYQFENNLNASWFANPASGYMRYIDAESFIDFQIINELANNVDGYRYSTFFYKQRDSEGGKLVAGPLWDFDLGYGNLDYSQRHMSTSQWCYTNYGPGEPNCIHWWARMMEDPVYELQLKTRYSRLRKNVLHTDSIMAYLDSRVAGLGDAIGRNFQRWQILGVRVWPNYYIGPTHLAEVNFLKNWIRNRLTWMDSQWLITTGTEDTPRLAEVLIYPNPAAGRIYVEPGNVSPGSYHVSVYDIQGKQVMSSRMDHSGGHAEGLDVGHLPSGVYLIRLGDDRSIWYSGKFLKK